MSHNKILLDRSVLEQQMRARDAMTTYQKKLTALAEKYGGTVRTFHDCVECVIPKENMEPFMEEYNNMDLGGNDASGDRI